MPTLRPLASVRTSWLRGPRGVVLSLLLLTLNASGKEKPEEQARPLLKSAAERSLLNADRKTPFSLTAAFTVHGLSAKRLDGKYGWLVNSEGDWAKHLSFADYKDLEIGRGSSVRIKRSVQFQPIQAAIVQNAFSNPLYIDQAGDVVERFFMTSENHVKLRCADLIRGKSRRTICIDPDQNLRTIAFKSSRIIYEYSDYKPAGRKFVPHRITAKRGSTTLLEMSVEEVALDSELDSRLPDPPEGAIQRSGCLAPSLPTLKHSEVPGFPMSAPIANFQGQVMIYVLIGSDGTVRNPVVTQTGGESLDSSALEAVRHWQYEPAKCGDTPVEFETEVPVNFIMQVREEHFGWPR
jgi:TonB family protein